MTIINKDDNDRTLATSRQNHQHSSVLVKILIIVLHISYQKLLTRDPEICKLCQKRYISIR